MGQDTFSSPTMRARAALVRGLAMVDELERAAARGDDLSVARLATAIKAEVSKAETATYEAWLANVTIPGGPPETETEARAAWGDR